MAKAGQASDPLVVCSVGQDHAAHAAMAQKRLTTPGQHLFAEHVAMNFGRTVTHAGAFAGSHHNRPNRKQHRHSAPGATTK